VRNAENGFVSGQANGADSNLSDVLTTVVAGEVIARRDCFVTDEREVKNEAHVLITGDSPASPAVMTLRATTGRV
jgi:hypothetical protein